MLKKWHKNSKKKLIKNKLKYNNQISKKNKKNKNNNENLIIKLLNINIKYIRNEIINI